MVEEGRQGKLGLGQEKLRKDGQKDKTCVCRGGNAATNP